MAVSAAITPARPGEYGRSARLLAGVGAGAGADAASAASGLGDDPCEDAGSVFLVDIVALLGPLSERLVLFRRCSMTGIPDEWRAHPTAKPPTPQAVPGLDPLAERVGPAPGCSASVAAVSAPLVVVVDRVENQPDDHGA